MNNPKSRNFLIQIREENNLIGRLPRDASRHTKVYLEVTKFNFIIGDAMAYDG